MNFMNLMNLEILWTESRILQATDNIINLLKLLMYILQTTNWFLMIPIKMKLDERQKHVKPYFQPGIHYQRFLLTLQTSSVWRISSVVVTSSTTRPKWFHRANICSWNIYGTSPWDIPGIFGKSSLWNSGKYSQIMFQEYWI